MKQQTNWREKFWVGAESFDTREEQQARLAELTAAQTAPDAHLDDVQRDEEVTNALH